MDSLKARLDALRGATPARDFTARTLAALTANPGCARRAVLDAAGTDKSAIAAHAGFPPAEGQSRFALARGTEFESLVLADGAAELLRLLRETLGFTVPEVSYVSLDAVGDDTSRDARYRNTRGHLLRIAADRGDPGTLFDHPVLRLQAGGHAVYLEPDVVAFQIGGQFHVIEIKSFAVIDDQADAARVAAAATQAAVYIHALRQLLAEAGRPAEAVSHNAILITPRNFSNRPTAAFVDVRRKLAVLRRQLERLASIETVLQALPDGLTFDLLPGPDGRPRRAAEELDAALGAVEARYRPSCLSACELAHYCRAEARCAGSLDVFGPTVRENLGGVDSLDEALEFAAGTRTPGAEQEDAAHALRHADRLRRELAGGAV